MKIAVHKRLFASTLAASIAACATGSCVSMQAGSDYYTATDFSGYESYAWIADQPLITPPGAVSRVTPLNVRRVREAIERELENKGFTRIDPLEQADFVVAFTIGLRDMIDIDAYPVAFRGQWGWRPPYYGPEADVYMYTEGTLAIDIFDGASREPVWHGWAKKRITGSDVDAPEAVIDRAVAAILADYPPGDP